MPPASFSTSTLTPDRLLAGDMPVVARKITVVSGQNLVRGTVLGKITSGGKYNKSLSAAADGSQTPDLILAEDCDASGGDKVALAYATGIFAQEALTIGTAHTADSIREGLRGKGIHIIPTAGA
jgi:hypothetical protein